MKKKTKSKVATAVKIKPLDTEFESCKFLHKQLKRVGDVAIFKKDRIANKYDSTNYPAGYEVVIIKRHNGYKLGDQYIEPAETYPSNSLWGILGWTYGEKELEKAQRKFDELVKKQADPSPKRRGRRRTKAL